MKSKNALIVISITLLSCTNLGNIPIGSPEKTTDIVNEVKPSDSKEPAQENGPILSSAISKRSIPVEQVPGSLTGSGSSSLLPQPAAPSQNSSSGYAAAPAFIAPSVAPSASSSSSSAVPVAVSTSQSDAYCSGSNTGYGYGSDISSSMYSFMYLFSTVLPFIYGGSSFNNYVVTFAEESLYPGTQETEMLQVYEKTIQPIIKEWDEKARLLINSGWQGQIDKTTDSICLPADTDGKSLRIKPDWTFSFASTNLKETLTIYVTKDNTRVYRSVWGEPQVEMDKVKIGSKEAIDIARKTYADRNPNPGYPVYPSSDESSNNYGNRKMVYDLHEQLNWTFILTQQGQQIRYFLNFNYQEPAKPLASPSPTQTYYPYQPLINYSGSIVIDAVTGKVLNLNRPYYYDYSMSPSYATATPSGSPWPTVTGSPIPTYTPTPTPMPSPPLIIFPPTSLPPISEINADTTALIYSMSEYR